MTSTGTTGRTVVGQRAPRPSAAGNTAIPRWSRDRVPGVAEHRLPLDAVLASAVRRFAAERALAPSAVLPAAHARVLAVLSAEPDVVAGYRAGPGAPHPWRVHAAGGTWAGLVDDAARTGVDPIVTPSPFETVVDVDERAGDDPRDLPDGVVAAVSWPDGGDELRVRYRTEALDADAAARFAGYHAAALALVVSEPDADPSASGLVGPEERRHQLEDMAGPERRRPARAAHELFEDRVREHPWAIAVVDRNRIWTYTELNERANRLAHVLLAQPLRREDVVAVVTERNVDWLTAVLAILKAGCVYLPIEPHFPADRISTTLRRAGAALVLTEAGSSTTLDEAVRSLPGVTVRRVDDAVAAADPATCGNDPGLPTAGDQAAYIYFTSGSTGLPKGAMCEHAGMVNHLFAKIEDLGVGPGTVVAQTAPQCFDISLWQLLAALLVGGRTLIVEQEVVLDAGRFVDTLVRERVEVVQLVPSYLEAVLTLLEQAPRALPDLRAVSATGEALRPELVARWFAAQPGIALVNAYGLTETSDDTNHAVLHRMPDSGRIPLGPPIPNVWVGVVDERLDPVPLGAPGEIVFSGICVGRGYVGDPERTRAAFVPDPHRPGGRLYRSGDQGRWLPDGSLEFLGRRDTQVKIRGFRIEIGEVDNALLRVPGLRDGAVVVAGAGGSAQLVAFWTGPSPIDPDVLTRHLADALPGYMVPARFVRCAELPLTGNGKIDRRALSTLAEAAEPARPAAGRTGPRTPSERRVAAAFASVLDLDPAGIGRDDGFFDRGGTSLSAVKLVIALNRAVTLRQVVATPVVADLATLVADPATAGHPHPHSDQKR